MATEADEVEGRLQWPLLCARFGRKISFAINILQVLFIFIPNCNSSNLTVLLLHYFLGAFATLREATVSFVMSVHLFARMEQLFSIWTDFHEI
jgi:hypothetical protein